MSRAVRGAGVASLVEILRRRAELHPERNAFTFLANGEDESGRLDYGELDRRSRAFAARLQEVAEPGDRVILFYPPGLDYVVSFFGCLYAGAIAVPAYPPRKNRNLDRVRAIAASARPVAAFSTAQLCEQRHRWQEDAPEVAGLPWLAAEEVRDEAAEAWSPVDLRREDLAFLQYTSGSTSAPKGVMVSHGNLLANMDEMRRSNGYSSRSRGVSWLPLFHDMGLIGNMLEAVFVGFPLVLLPPATFLQKPARWLEAITRYKATISGGPNFAYELCVNAVSEEQRDALDLSHWRVAFNGAEPVREKTIERFSEYFRPAGFRKRTFLPCYGLAEGTLMVSGGPRTALPKVRALDAAVLEQGRAEQTAAEEAPSVPLVASGRVADGFDVRIVEPESRRLAAADEVGEIWIAGESVAAGYFDLPEETEAAFGARIEPDGEGPYFRTGDLGFLVGDDLYVTGRLKDLIILRGRNLYPQDIELTVEESHPDVRPGCVAAFALEVDGQEALGLVAEIRRQKTPDLPAVTAAIRQAVAEEHEAELAGLQLVRAGSLPKTSSGKVQRRKSRELFLGESLHILSQWHRGQSLAAPAPEAQPVPVEAPVSAPAAEASEASEGLERWIAQRVAAHLERPAGEIDLRTPFNALGLDSVTLVRLSGELEEHLGRSLSPTLLYEQPTIERLAAHLVGGGVAPAATASAPAGVIGEPVALVGIGCRFPGADGPEAFWRLLRDGVDAISEVPGSRWSLDELYDPDPDRPGKMNTRWGGFLEGVDAFDPSFFGISPREAERMDPQQRLLLETAFEALEDAGIPRENLAGTETGVFVGISHSEYGQMQMADPAFSNTYAGTGSALSIAANRLSYWLDANGPSLAVDTACSSSLVAFDLACRAVAQGECSAALAAGVNLLLTPAVTVNFTKGRFMAEDGRCKAFDARANGYVRGEGVGVVVLKPLSRALADGDRIYAVCLGGAVNQDGRSNGLTAPNPKAQEAVLRRAYQRAGVSPGDVAYVEAHGTGTSLGDPIEARALARVLEEGRVQGEDRSSEACLLGSVKTNVGHLEAAAGIAGVIKTALALHHGEIPPSLHFEEANPEIPFDELPLEVVTRRRPWPERKVAGVSSFGFGGTNAHVVLAAPPVSAAGTPEALEEPAAGGPYLLPLSAHDEDTLAARVAALAAWIEEGSPGADLEPRDLCHTAALHRSHHDHRLALTFDGIRDLRECLEVAAEGGDLAEIARGRRRGDRRRKLAFVFPGHGSQWAGMGRELLAAEPVFRRALEACATAMAPYLDRPLLELLEDPEGAWMEEVEHTQMLLFAVQVGLADLWASRGVRPDAVVGHSVGEVAAAHVAGVLTLAQAVEVIARRGALIQPLAGTGGMLAVALDEATAARHIEGFEDRLAVGVSNAPEASVLSGELGALEEVEKRLAREGIFHRRVAIVYASHSPQMVPVAPRLEVDLQGLEPAAPRLPIYSTVRGGLAAPSREPQGDFGAAYWGKNLRQPVLFQQTVKGMLEDGFDLFLEVSAHPVLLKPIADTASQGGHGSCETLASLRRDQPQQRGLLQTAGRLYCAGRELDWRHIQGAGERIDLPSYPWQRQRYWLDLPKPAPVAVADDLFARATTFAHQPGTHVWTGRLDRDWSSPSGAGKAPGGAMMLFLALTQAAVAQIYGEAPFRLEDLDVGAGLPSGADEREVQLVLHRENDREARFDLFSLPPAAGPVTPPGEWVRHAGCRVVLSHPLKIAS